jgi:hypothetical protein
MWRRRCGAMVRFPLEHMEMVPDMVLDMGCLVVGRVFVFVP